MTTITGKVQSAGMSRSRQAQQDLLTTWAIRVLMILASVVILLPVLWTVTASLQPGSAVFSASPLPSAVTFDHYKDIFNQGFLIWVKNSILICGSTSIVALLVNTLAAYAFSRLRFRGKKSGLMLLLLLQMFPQMLGLAALYGLLITFNLLDTLQGIVLVYIGGSAFNIWLLKNYMDSVPRELDESAYVDGANSWQTFWRVLLPLMRPMLATSFIFSFTGNYNDFIFASLFLQSPDNFTVTVGLYRLINANYTSSWGSFAAGSILASLPILLVYLLLQKQLVAGLSQGAVKG